jgi:hypothetical protein
VKRETAPNRNYLKTGHSLLVRTITALSGQKPMDSRVLNSIVLLLNSSNDTPQLHFPANGISSAPKYPVALFPLLGS